jgi:putative transposase
LEVKSGRRVLVSLLREAKALAKGKRCDKKFGMRESWPHAPPHYFTPRGTCIITAAMLHRRSLFDLATKLNLLRGTTFELAKSYELILQAWAFFPNHYHLVVSFENTKTTHRDFMRHLHRELTMRLNRIDAIPGRRAMYDFWDTHRLSRSHGLHDRIMCIKTR